MRVGASLAGKAATLGNCIQLPRSHPPSGRPRVNSHGTLGTWAQGSFLWVCGALEAALIKPVRRVLCKHRCQQVCCELAEKGQRRLSHRTAPRLPVSALPLSGLPLPLVLS